ncbi:hypothetical protein FHETE_6838 [Fusarium heterosporum]|uniref:Neutral protease 2 n=1 Tax=Fusarium heterosporum TaxID=42747 RepID=A0A8H5T8G7_FUSHE|nr:hypothetical protein FHETE_6838 [Fusarium heterosporum]
MRFYRSLILLAQLVTGVQSHLSLKSYARQSGDLSVSLVVVAGKATEVKAILTNNGSGDLSLLSIGTILDERPVEKVKLVNEHGEVVPFMGIRLSLGYDGLRSKDFAHLSPGSSVFRTVDLSTVYDLKPGTYSVYAEGSIPSVSRQTKESASLSFRSKSISIKIDKTSSAVVKQKGSKRTIIDGDGCTSEQLKATADGVKNCEILARAAAADASDVHSARFVEYFKSNETATREHVTGRLLAVADECATSDSGNTRVSCHDEWGYCESDGPLLAYTTWVNGYITMCPLFYETRPPLPEICHKQDHATTTIHEMTHARPVYEQEVSTQDYAYGYENSTALDPLSCLYNADQYSLYANARKKASYSITAFGHDAPRLRQILTRIAFADTTPSSTAVLKSALALASFHRDDAADVTARYKVAALSKLAESTQGSIGITESASHVAAGIVLCTLEVQQNSMKSSHWLWYVCGATKIAKNARMDEIKGDQDVTALVGWIHYCNTVSRFSLRHWQPNITLDQIKASDIGFDEFHPAVCGHGQPESLEGKPHEILHLLSEVFNGVVASSDPHHSTKEYRNQLYHLESKLRHLGENASNAHAHAVTETPDAIFSLVIELYRLSTLIYLRRASLGILPTDKEFMVWVAQAFALLEQLPTCQWPLPLLIFGCEAQSDEQRRTIVDIIHRTIGNQQGKNIATAKRVIETIWIQTDLASGYLDYVHKLGVIISSTQKSVPAFI